MIRPRSHLPAWELLRREHGVHLGESELHDLARAVHLGDSTKFWRMFSRGLSCCCATVGGILLASALTGITTTSISLTCAAIAFVAAGVLFTRP